MQCLATFSWKLEFLEGATFDAYDLPGAQVLVKITTASNQVGKT